MGYTRIGLSHQGSRTNKELDRMTLHIHIATVDDGKHDMETEPEVGVTLQVQGNIIEQDGVRDALPFLVEILQDVIDLTNLVHVEDDTSDIGSRLDEESLED